MKNIFGTLIFAALSTVITPAAAITAVGGYNFEDNAFADTLISSSGGYSVTGDSLAAALTDKNPGTFALSTTLGVTDFVQLGFTDNVLVNGLGADLVLFELGVPSVFGVSITIGGTTRSYASVSTGAQAGGFGLNAAAIDLSDFGIAFGASLSSIVILMGDASNTQPSLSLVGALNSRELGSQIPEPASLSLAVIALLGLAATRRRPSL